MICASAPCSATDSLLQMFRVPSTLHLDPGKRGFDVAQIVGRQFHGSGSEIFFQAMDLRRARDRNDPGFLGKQPGECDLGARHVLLGRNFAEHVDEGLVRLASLRSKARDDVAKVLAVEARALVDRTREEALAERAERNEADPQFLKSWQNLLLRLSPPQRVFALEGSDGLNGMSAPDRLRACFGQSEVLDHAFLDQVLQG